MRLLVKSLIFFCALTAFTSAAAAQVEDFIRAYEAGAQLRRQRELADLRAEVARAEIAAAKAQLRRQSELAALRAKVEVARAEMAARARNVAGSVPTERIADTVRRKRAAVLIPFLVRFFVRHGLWIRARDGCSDSLYP